MKKEKTLKEAYLDPEYWFVESEMGLSFLPIEQAKIVIASGYGKKVPKSQIKFK